MELYREDYVEAAEGCLMRADEVRHLDPHIADHWVAQAQVYATLALSVRPTPGAPVQPVKLGPATVTY